MSADEITRAEERPLSILVVDDDPDSADSLALLLEHWNHRVCVAYDGAQAIETFRRERPSVALIDISLPDMDGYEVARALKKEEHPATLVALTGYGDDGDLRASKEAGFDRHFVKPIDLRSLRELLLGAGARS
ncbi:MAG TPA: response regulator [Candidatus Binatia bacterium]|nr:response regulator [Candidatus Binatia bacterium]